MKNSLKILHEYELNSTNRNRTPKEKMNSNNKDKSYMKNSEIKINGLDIFIN